MSITISNLQPTTPNMSDADLVYRVTSTNVNQSQFRFVCDVQDENRNVLVRLKQQPNPDSNGIFNVGSIIDDYMEADQPWKASPIQKTSNGYQRFHIAFGEEYGTSASSSTSIRRGTDNTIGEPAKSGSSLYIGEGVVERGIGSYNFPSASFYTELELPTDSGAATSYQNNALTNSPLTQSISQSLYHTIALYNGSVFDDADTSGFGQDVFQIQVTGYANENGEGGQVFNFQFSNTVANGGGPRTGSGAFDTYAAYSSSFTDDQRLLYIGVGPENLKGQNDAITGSNFESYRVFVYPQADDGLEGPQVISDTLYNIKDKACGYDGVRFAFQNELGAWDYYTMPLADSKTDAITRNNFRQNDIPYESNGNYSYTSRGDTTYNISYEETRTVESDYLTQEEADWLRELIESPNVYIQEGDNFKAVTFTNSSFTYKRNPRSQKLYTLTAEFKISKPRRSR